MCILFIQIPSNGLPLIIANNRDEFFKRSTSRGALTSGGLYSPTDLEGGGTWISYDHSRFRYAIILNFHSWRYLNHDPFQSESNGTTSGVKSRGLYVQEYIDSTLSPDEFAGKVFDTNDNTRGYNLIIGDQDNARLVCKYEESLPPKIATLISGQIYGISNGFMDDDNWQKVVYGKQIFAKILREHRCKDASIHTGSQPEPSSLSRRLLFELLCDSMPYDDPTLGDQSTPGARTLSAIFVNPTVINHQIYRNDAESIDSNVGPMFGTRTSSVLIAAINASSNKSVEILERDLDVEAGTWSVQLHQLS